MDKSKINIMNRRQDLQQFFISANTARDYGNFDLDEFTDRYLKRNPISVNKNDLLPDVVGRSEQFYCKDESYHKVGRCSKQCTDCKDIEDSLQ